MDMTMQLLMQLGAAMQMTQTSQTTQASRPAESSGGDESGKSSFQTMLEEKRQPAEKPPVQAESQEPEQSAAPEGTENPAAQLAAMLLAGQPAAVTVTPLTETGETQPAAVTVLDLTALQAAGSAAAAQPAAEGAISQAAAPQTALPRTEAPQQGTEPAPEGEIRQMPSADARVQPAERQETAQTGEHRAQTDAGAKMNQQDLPEVTTAVSAGETQVFQQVEHMPVRVGDAPQLDTAAPDFDTQAARTITEAFQRGQETVELRLSPENLGSVTVSLSKGADGTLHVVLAAESERTLRLLTEHTAHLSLLLQSSGQGEARVEVTHTQESQQSWQQPDPNGERQQDGHSRHQEQNRQRGSGDSFLQQLRLGLLEPDGAA